MRGRSAREVRKSIKHARMSYTMKRTLKILTIFTIGIIVGYSLHYFHPIQTADGQLSKLEYLTNRIVVVKPQPDNYKLEPIKMWTPEKGQHIIWVTPQPNLVSTPLPILIPTPTPCEKLNELEAKLFKTRKQKDSWQKGFDLVYLVRDTDKYAVACESYISYTEKSK